MEKIDFFSKLKDEFLSLVVGVVVALPAIGIVVPQLFAILGDEQDQQISGSFKVFTMLYFAMPLILLFIWSFFQFNNSILRNMRPMIWTGILVLAAVFVLLLIPLKTAGSNQQNIFRLLPWLIMLVLAAYWRFFLIAKRKLIGRLSRIRLKLDALKRGEYVSSLAPEYAQEKVKIFEEKRTKALAAIKLMFFFLFIATHLVVVLLLILFNTIYNNVFQATVLISLYAAVLVYYRIDYDLRELRNKSLLSKSTFSVLLVLVLVSIAMVFYMSAIKPGSKKHKSFFDTSNSAYIRDFDHLDNAEKLHKFILTLDSDYRQTVITSSEESEKMLPYRYLSDLLNDTAVNKDTLAAFKMRMIRYGLLESNKNYKDGLEPLWPILASPHDSLLLKLKFDSLFRLTGIAQTLTPADYKKRARKLQKGLKNIPAVLYVCSRITADSSTTAGRQSANRQIRAIKLQQLTAESYQAIGKQSVIIKNTQRAGMVVFLTTLIIALAFLMILSYSDDLFHPETLREVTAVRRSLQVVCLVIIILLIPLVKPVPENELDPAKPTALFLTANWNLAKVFKSTDEPASVGLSGKRRILSVSAIDATGQDGDNDGTVGKNKCAKCCPDTMCLKFLLAKDTILTKLLIEWSYKQQNERKTIDSLYILALNRISAPRDNGQLAFLQSYLDEIRRTLSDSRQYNLQTHVAVDSAIRELDTIQKVLERSSYKTTLSSQRK